VPCPRWPVLTDETLMLPSVRASEYVVPTLLAGHRFDSLLAERGLVEVLQDVANSTWLETIRVVEDPLGTTSARPSEGCEPPPGL